MTTSTVRTGSGAERRLKLLATFLISLALLAAGAIAYGLHASWQNALELEARFLRNTSSSLVKAIDRRLATVAGALVLAATRGDDEAATGESAPRPLAEALARLRQLDPGIEDFAVIRSDGRRETASTSPNRDGAALARLAQAAVERHGARPTEQVLLTPATAFAPDHPNVLVVSRALERAGDVAPTIVLATVRMDELLATVAEVLTQEGGRVTILNGDFRVVARLPRAALGADLTDTPISRAIRSGPPAAVIQSRSTIDGKPLLTAYVASAQAPFYAVMSKDLPAIAAAWRAENIAEFTAFALLFIGLLVPAWRLFAEIRRQTRQQIASHHDDRARFHRALEGTRDGLAVWSAEGALLSWNSRFAELATRLGRAPHGTMRLDGFLDAATPGLDGGFDGGTLELPGGELIEIVHQRADNGDTVTTLRDVSAERAAQRRVAESEARFRDGIESMAEGFILWDRDDRMVAWNRRAAALLPVQAPLFGVGRRFEEILAHLASCQDGGMPSRADWLAELARRRNRRSQLGEVTTVVTSVNRIVEAVDRATSDGGIVSIYRDVTEQRALVDRLRSSEIDLRRSLAAERDMNDQQRRFVAMASHEFRTPLAIIDGAAQRLQATRLNPGPEGAKRLDRIRAAVSRMTEIIDRMLATARLDEGRVEFAPSVFDVAALAREVVRRQHGITPDAEIVVAAAPDVVEIEADVRLVDHVLTNLVSNAVKYSRARNRVDVRLTGRDDDVFIEVEDRGIGIPADEFDKVFTRFFRSRLAAGIAGTGIGLHLVREFVAMHGGEVTLRSEAGAGSTFVVRLPRRRQLAAAA